jgi:hypothetical protein
MGDVGEAISADALAVVQTQRSSLHTHYRLSFSHYTWTPLVIPLGEGGLIVRVGN